MSAVQKTLLAILGLWTVYFLVAVLCRPLFPVDETRYMAVAWEMHVNGQWILPTLNYQPYHHKPPLLFWLINVMWEIFGTSRWAATLVPLAMSLLCIGATFVIARLLAPGDEKSSDKVSCAAAVLLAFSAPVLIYGTIIMFDMMLAACVAMAMIALLLFVKTGRFGFVLLFGLATGLGVLAKGPVILIHVLFPWLLAPLWAAGQLGFERGRLRCYLMLVCALFVAAAVALSWAVPAAIMGGEKYREMIFWGQTAGRMVKAFDHQHPFWWYLPYLPVITIPWIFTPWFWRAARGFRSALPDWQVRFLLCWIVPVFLAFCAISGKQAHYLAPLFPAVSILLALLVYRLPDFTHRKIWRAGILVFIVLCVFQVVGRYTYFQNYDLRPTIAAWEPYRDRPLAFVHNYEGQLAYYGRLTKPLASLDLEDLRVWFRENPDGVAFVRYGRGEDHHVRRYEVLFKTPYKGSRTIALVQAKGE